MPTGSLEALWSAYERFELEGAAKVFSSLVCLVCLFMQKQLPCCVATTTNSEINYSFTKRSISCKALGRRALDDMRPRHNAAKAAYRLRRKHLEGLDPEQLALPPGERSLNLGFSSLGFSPLEFVLNSSSSWACVRCGSVVTVLCNRCMVTSPDLSTRPAVQARAALCRTSSWRGGTPTLLGRPATCSAWTSPRWRPGWCWPTSR